ncbi:transporter [Mucilaginibacter terrenus]|uniref:Transporter n=1 Tax=Mucilaginibacter terrenus TaxID=2482727 RepID=A0A3E2NP72_9SPHI|nr:transporter [Mucilaginibacter terrenus]RFZ82806.1 transporter [Mucilaginibacter terrenus]
MRYYYLATVLLVCLGFNNAFGQADTIKRYNLTHPVPAGKMKEMETDRPDVTESAYTVEAGHFQVESDLYRHVRNTSDGIRSIENSYHVANYKLGLSAKTDIQLVVPTFVSNTERDVQTGKLLNKKSGFDDITLRFKYNLWGSNGGKTALAVLPFISFPTSSFENNGVQGGVTFPFAAEITSEVKFGSQVSASFVKEDDNKYYNELLYSFTFGRSLFKQVDGFVEAYTTYSTYTKNADFFANGGLVFSVNSNLNIDAGLNYGLNKGTDKVYFIGFSFRH